MRIFLTGGTGLVGRHCAEGAMRAGMEVRALVRPTSSTEHLESLGCELVKGDITDAASVSGLMDGCDAVIHCAAQLGGSATTWAAHEHTNREGTETVVDEALRSGVARFVHVSTVAVYGRPDLHSRRPIDESAPLGLPGERPSFYERSKRAAEKVVRLVSLDRLSWTIVRPDIIVGEGDRMFTPRVLSYCRRRVIMVGGKGDVDLPIVYAGNVAAACLLCVEREEAKGRTYNVTDDGKLTVEELFELASGARRPLKVRVPLGIVGAAGRTLNVVAAVPGLRLPAGLSGRNLWYLSNSDPYSDQRIRAELGWKPATSTLDGWKKSLAWNLEHTSPT